jgi:O-antigen/teichoic acid export membrane protein
MRDTISDDPRAGGAAQTFSDRVVFLFVAQVSQTAIGIFNGIFLARLIGPSAKGDYYLLTTLPVTIMILVQLALAQAFGFYAARGQTLGLTAKSLALTVALSVPAFVVVVAMLPFLRSTFLHDLEPAQVILALCALPLLLNATFTTGIIMGRQGVRWLAFVGIAQALVTTLLIGLLVGTLALGVVGALWTFLLAAGLQAVGFFVGAMRVGARVPNSARASYDKLVRYGLPLYPGSLTSYFGYRADVYLLAWLLVDPSTPLGYYSMAVSMAEMVFFFPNAVSALFFPHVAGSTRADSDRQVAMVSRVTLLVTAAAALVLLPVATGLLRIILPAFTPALPALYILLPGVVTLSNTKVLSSYVAGLGMTGLTSAANVGAFFLNVVLNLALIPQYGILGASAASLVSYSASSITFSLIAAKFTKTPVLGFWIPRWTDIRFTVATAATLWRRMLRAFARP